MALSFTGASRALIVVLLLAVPAEAVEQVSLKRDGKPFHVSGKVLVQAADGGLLLLDPEGVLWAIQPDELVDHSKDDTPFEPLGRDELAGRLQAHMPADFRMHTTAHYLICYNTSRHYAQWCGALYERLYAAFHTYWKHQGFQLHEPDQMLVALVFDGKKSYSDYARTELGDATPAIVGYFSLRTNRVTMYDLTSADARLAQSGRLSSAAHVNRILSQPGSERTVATIIHEATHQLAFNCGLQTRYADIPLWVSEGIAVYFETPDLKSTRGWRRIGAVHSTRLAQFRRYLRGRPQDSLTTLLADDGRFRHAKTAPDAYAEAWVLNYYLLQKHARQYVQYLQALSKKGPLVYDTPEKRIALFREFFGEDLASLDQDLLRYISRLK